MSDGLAASPAQRRLITRPLPENYQASEAELFEPMQSVWLECLGLLARPKAYYYTEAQALFDAEGRLFAPSISYPGEATHLTRRFFWMRRAFKARRRVLGPCLLVSNKSSRNYYHWHADVLPKILHAQRATNFVPGTSLLLPQALLSLEFVRASLKLFWPYAVEPLQPHSVYWLAQAFYADAAAPRLNQDPLLLREVITHLLAAHPAASPLRVAQARKAYIRRGAAARAKRCITNEAELEQLLASRGFETVEFESMSYAEQIRFSRECAVMVSINSAGLTNSMFMPAGGTVLEIRSRTPKGNCYWPLANACGHRYFYAIGERDPSYPADHIGSLKVNIESMARTLALI